MTRSKWRQRLRDALAVVGIASALLTVLFAIRSGYLYVARGAEQRAWIGSWQQLAREQFERPAASLIEHFGALQLAGYALKQALQAAPGRLDLQQQAFLTSARLAYVDLETQPYIFDEWSEIQGELSTEGWRVLERLRQDGQRAKVLLALARLEWWRSSGDAEANAERLLRQARALDPDNAEIDFQLARMLMGQASGRDEAVALLEGLVAGHPDDPRYLTALGRRKLKDGETARALGLLARAATGAAGTSDWAAGRATRVARSLIHEHLEQAIAAGGPLPSAIDPALADSLFEEFRTVPLTGIYWWRRARPQRAIHDLTENDRRFRREPLGRLIRLELALYDMREDQLPPSLEEIEASLTRLRGREAVAPFVAEIEAYLGTVRERLLFTVTGAPGTGRDMGMEVQFWPSSPAGLLVRRVVPGFVAAQAGLRPGDRLHRLNDRVLHDLDEFVQQLQELPGGSELRFTVERNGEFLSMTGS